MLVSQNGLGHGRRGNTTNNDSWKTTSKGNKGNSANTEGFGACKIREFGGLRNTAGSAHQVRGTTVKPDGIGMSVLRA